MQARNFLLLLALVMWIGCPGAIDAQESNGEEANHTTTAEGDASGEAGHGEQAGEDAPNPLSADIDLSIWTLVVFVILLFVLKKVAWGPVVQALAAREAGISDNIAAAAAKHEDAKRLLAEHQAKIDLAADEVRQMLEEARRDAEATKTQIVAEARSAADAERQRALREIDLAMDSAVKTLAEQSANLAVELAGKVVRQEISPQRQSEIVREALGLMSANASNN